ncbi:MAG: prepilin-type N-terminal cleavage/methylation domain-containing protein [Rickettsiales bacterium]
MTKSPNHQCHNSAFTLMELSIVIVIIGLLVGGIMIGRDLIRASEIRGILSDYDRYNTAIATFRSKYNALPGDMTNAIDYWGIAWGNSSDNYTTTCFTNSKSIPIGSQLTCNGDGNGMIAGSSACSNNGISFTLVCNEESVSIWQHLANANLVSGSYIPAYYGSITLSFSPVWVRGKGGNIPSSRHNEKEGFILEYICNPTAYFFPASCNHYFFYGTQSATENGNWVDFPFYPAFTAMEALGIDTKIDDGKAGTGRVITHLRHAFSPFVPTCATSTVASTAQYDTSSSDKTCSLMFKASF